MSFEDENLYLIFNLISTLIQLDAALNRGAFLVTIRLVFFDIS